MFSLQKWPGFRLLADKPARSAQSINRHRLGKIKFIGEFHIDLRMDYAHSSDTEKRHASKFVHREKFTVLPQHSYFVFFTSNKARTSRQIRSISTMKTLISIVLAGAISTGVVCAQGPGERAADAAQNTADTAKHVGRSVARGTKNAAETVAEALTPDADAHRVNVTMTEYKFEMPATLKPGKTAFVVKNAGKKAHNIQIKGNGTDEKFAKNLKPNETRVLHIVLKRGPYDVTCPVDFHMMKGMTAKFTVR